jgi:hypothetical protein
MGGRGDAEMSSTISKMKALQKHCEQPKEKADDQSAHDSNDYLRFPAAEICHAIRIAYQDRYPNSRLNPKGEAF